MTAFSYRSPRAAGLGRATERVLLSALPLAFAVGLAARATQHYFWDFRVFWQAGTDVLEGRSPYPPPHAELLAHQSSFVYPPETALLFVPFAALPYQLAAAIFLALLFVCVAATLWVLDVRDWRCYGAALLMAPVLSAIGNGALSCFLALGVALAWRYRDRAAIAGAAVAGVIVTKVFLWPVWLWLVATRRFRAAAGALLGGALVTLGAWAVLGFAGLGNYPHLLRILANVEQADGYSPIALGLALGLPGTAARVVALALGAAAVAVLFVVGRRREDHSLRCALAASLLLSPIVWLHYFVLLIVPLAIARPRFSAAWVVLPLPFWLATANGQSHGNLRSILVALVAAAALLLVGTRPWAFRGRRSTRPGAPAQAIGADA